MAEFEGGSVVFFVVQPRLGTVEAGNSMDCRVIPYAWNWVLASRPLIGRNRVLDMSCALYISVIKCEIQTWSQNILLVTRLLTQL